MLKFPPIITHAYIMVTEQCNARCEYCYIKDRQTANELPFEYMEKVKKAFTCYNKPLIVFFGGEPTLKLPLIKKIVESYKDDFRFQIVTNGIANLHKFVEEVWKPYKSIFDVQLSWDGNTKTRIMANGKESNNIVYENLVKELKNGFACEGRAVLNDDSVQSFYNTYKTFKELHSKYLFSADFTIAHQLSFSQSYHIVLGQQLQMIYNDIRQSLNDESFFMPRFLLKTITNVIQNRPVASCDIGTCVVIKPNGDIYPCTILSQQDDRFKLGNINDTCDTEMITKLRKPTPCQKDCAFKSICDGGCRYERIKLFPNTWECDVCNHTCSIYQTLYEETVRFLNSLSKQESEMLYQMIGEYNMWSIDYQEGLTDNSKRLCYKGLI